VAEAVDIRCPFVDKELKDQRIRDVPSGRLEKLLVSSAEITGRSPLHGPVMPCLIAK
jgi:hypothetical protein